MSEEDQRLIIERYPHYDEEGNVTDYVYCAWASFGKGVYDLAGYTNLDELLQDIYKMLSKQERVKVEK